MSMHVECLACNDIELKARPGSQVASRNTKCLHATKMHITFIVISLLFTRSRRFLRIFFRLPRLIVSHQKIYTL